MEGCKTVLVDEVLINVVVGRHREGGRSLVGFTKVGFVVLWLLRRVSCVQLGQSRQQAGRRENMVQKRDIKGIGRVRILQVQEGAAETSLNRGCKTRDGLRAGSRVAEHGAPKVRARQSKQPWAQIPTRHWPAALKVNKVAAPLWSSSQSARLPEPHMRHSKVVLTDVEVQT